MQVGIVGYGRLGRAVELMAEHFPGTRAAAVFTKREVGEVKTHGTPVYHIDRVEELSRDIDCLLICTGSSHDTPVLVPRLAEACNTVDSYDRHADIARHRAAADRGARLGGNASLVSVGWDPGLLSLFRIYAAAFMPYGVTNTFWGRGVSQGHSEAIRRINGVRQAVQYTEPRTDALTLAELGVRLTDEERHKRVCYVVAPIGEKERIEAEIRGLEGYFLGYETDVRFISEEEFRREHSSASHGGRVLSVGRTGVYGENSERLSLSLSLDSNPEFTAGIMLSCALAAVRLKREGRCGAYTLADIPPSYLLPRGKTESDYL